MTLTTVGAPNIDGNQLWRYDDVAGDFVPVVGNAPTDLRRGIGRFSAIPVGGVAGDAAIARALANGFLPPGIAFVQSVRGAETNTFTTRVAIGGTFLNAFNLAATQVVGTFPAGALNLLGRTLRVRASGTLGTTGTPNLTIDLALGAAGANVLATSGVLALAAATSPAPWFLDVQATVVTVGASGAIISEGLFSYSTSSSVVVIPWTLGNSTRGTPLTIDLTAALAFNIYATCGTSDVANRIRCDTLVAEVLF
jgi:hypothetical protein